MTGSSAELARSGVGRQLRRGVVLHDRWEQRQGVHNWFSNNPFTVGTETATARPDRDYVYGGRTSGSSSGATLTRRSPRPSGTTSTPRGRTCSPGTTACTTGPTISASRRRPSTCRRTTSASVGSGTTTSRATPRPAASGGPASLRGARQRQPDHAAGRQAPITNMYLWQPIAGAFCPLRRRRLRHVRHRARVHACDLQPDGRRGRTPV